MNNLNLGLADILLISPMIALFLFSLVPITLKTLRGNQEQQPLATLIEALIGLLVTVGLYVIFAKHNASAAPTAFNGQLIFDGMTTWASIIAVVVAGARRGLARASGGGGRGGEAGV